MKKLMLLSLVLILAFGMVGTAFAGGTVAPVPTGPHSEDGVPCDDFPGDLCTGNSNLVGGDVPGGHLWAVRKAFVPVPPAGYEFVGLPAKVVTGSAGSALLCFDGAGVIYERHGSHWDLVGGFPYLGQTCANVSGGTYALFAAK